MTAVEKQAQIETDNLWVAGIVLANPEKYKAGGLMHEWALIIVGRSKVAQRK